MRIIGGSFKGKKLTRFTTGKIRPTSDIVREAVFNIIGTRIELSVFIDLFAGTGGVGLEALSRGSKEVVFVDNSKNSCNILNKNLLSISFKGNVRLIKADIKKALTILEKEGCKADIIYLDPPYKSNHYDSLLNELGQGILLGKESIVIAEHFFKKTLQAEYGTLIKNGTKRYGDTVIDLYSPYM